MNFNNASPVRSPLLRRPLSPSVTAAVQPPLSINAPDLTLVAALDAPAAVHTDPMAVLTSIQGVAYEWDIVSGAMHWGANAREVARLKALRTIRNAREFSGLLAAEGQASRRSAIEKSGQSDSGAGVPYQIAYAFGLRAGEIVQVEETGRWFAGLDRKPARAHGLLRVVDGAPAQAQTRAFDQRDPDHPR